MKVKNRILATLLAMVLILSVLPVSFAAAGTVTVTWVTPSGTTTETVTAGTAVTFPEAASYGDYLFDCWVIEEFELSDGSDIYDFYYAEDSLTVDTDITFYALYYFPESELEVPEYYWVEYPADYNGEFAIVGFNLDPEDSEYLDTMHPVVLDENGKDADAVARYGAVASESYYGFSCAAENFVYTFELQNNGTYTIRNNKTGKYLSLSGMDITFAATPNASSYWNVILDSYGYECIVSAQNNDLVLLYDFYECCFAIFDNAEYYIDGYFPLDLFYIALYGRETINYMYTTNVPGVTPDEPIEPDHDCPSMQYTDLSVDEWYHSGVDFVLKNGYMNGVSSTTFRPNGTLNRAMVATVLYRIAGQPAVEGTCGFTDVAAGQWYTDAVIWAQENGIVTGYNDNTFRPTKEITRQEMAVMLARYAKLLGWEIGGGDLTAYPDAEAVASWAQEAMAWCVEKGLINGVQSGDVSNLKPGNNATRAQFATIMARFMTL